MVFLPLYDMKEKIRKTSSDTDGVEVPGWRHTGVS